MDTLEQQDEKIRQRQQELHAKLGALRNLSSPQPQAQPEQAVPNMDDDKLKRFQSGLQSILGK
jgi:hypothetical protein